MKKFYSKQEEIRAIVEWTIRANSREKAEKKIDAWEYDEEEII